MLNLQVRDLENELNTAQRCCQESEKDRRKYTREIKELQYQVAEDKKNEERLQDLINKLQQKLKVYKRQMEELEQTASSNLSKYRQVLTQLQDAEERADMAENSLVKYRSKSRLNLSSSIGGIYHSASSSMLMRNFSRSASAMDVMREEDRRERED
ncbi:unnamed protein product [Soboliphyme baturini]|uniref:Myosin_tail_1 domain-containing protein n=1 Tax=Soboliphyme baturini TaxID=241478 RepID=A0A183IGU8_9BILA|nr:unnamed protein product [Soboliphyme baturini]